jgi:hypothetical protein
VFARRGSQPNVSPHEIEKVRVTSNFVVRMWCSGQMMGNRATLRTQPQRHYQEKQSERTTGLEPATLTLAR